MARRLLAAAFAASFILPAAGSAQLMPLQDDPSWTPSFRVTPFIGYLTAADREERWMSGDDDGAVILHTGGATAVGVNLEKRILGSWGVTAAAAYGPRGATTVEFIDEGGFFEIEGSDIMLARLGASFNLRDPESALAMRRLNASVFGGGVVMLERPRGEPTGEQALDDATHIGVNVGVNGELPFASDRFAVQLGIENNFMWWGEQTSVRTSSDASHTWLLRAGMSFRFR